jgi:hypothetical protein
LWKRSDSNSEQLSIKRFVISKAYSASFRERSEPSIATIILEKKEKKEFEATVEEDNLVDLFLRTITLYIVTTSNSTTSVEREFMYTFSTTARGKKCRFGPGVCKQYIFWRLYKKT